MVKFTKLKFIYSEKATKFCEIFTLLLSYVVPVKSKEEILQNLVAFSEYINFKSLKGQIFSQNPQNLGAASTIKYTAPERAAEDRIEINAKIMMNGCLGRHCNHDIKPFLFHLHGTNFVAHNWAEIFFNFMRSYLAQLFIPYL